MNNADPSQCRHSRLALLPGKKKRLRCRHCHLTIAEEELGNGYCPECFESRGIRRNDFEAVAPDPETFPGYRCEDCGALIR